MSLEPLTMLPRDIQRDWSANLYPASGDSAYRLVSARRTDPLGYQAQRIVVLVLDENGFPLPSIPVAFSYSTAPSYNLTEKFTWSPPLPRRADVVPTGGGGQIDHVQGSVVQAGMPGGVSVYLLDPALASDVLTGGGMLADHTGLHLTFQRRRAGVLPIDERLDAIEQRLSNLEK